MVFDLSGEWLAEIDDGAVYSMKLPGTLDENKIGHKDVGANQWHPEINLGNADENFDGNAPIATRFTRKYTFEGEARISKNITFSAQKNRRVFLEAERARCLKVLVGHRDAAQNEMVSVPDFVPASISTPHIFEVTGLLQGESKITFLSDNSYPGLPHDAIVYSSAATDETQTNWNGILGYVRLRTEEPVFIHALRVYPERDGKNTVTVFAEISADRDFEGTLILRSEALETSAQMNIAGQAGMQEYVLKGLKLACDAKRWDEEEGNLYEMTAQLMCKNAVIFDSKTATFGIRTFGDNGNGRLALNGRTLFIRSEANCAEFPEQGHPPMSVEEWTNVLLRYRSYGINCMRFHSHCPPEAAFIAADRIGMMMQPELSHWNPRDAFESEESYTYYCRELKQTILMLANHPSFVMLTYGNELAAGELGHSRMQEMVELAHELDPTRLYAPGSNNHYGNNGCDAYSDFYAAQKYYEEDLRGVFAGNEDGLPGFINKKYPDTCTDYKPAMEKMRTEYKKPVISFEVGQFEVLPDFDELSQFHGISDPVNFKLIQNRVKKAGITDQEWKKYVEATGELSRIGYREEIEAAMRTEELSGISLLGLQDFPGQGTALVGMLNSHLEPKPFPFAQPEKFRAFFKNTLPLVYLPKYTWENHETLTAEVRTANFGKKEICGEVKFELTAGKGTENEKIRMSGTLPYAVCPMGKITSVGSISIKLDRIEKSEKLDLVVRIADVEHSYPIWVYVPEQISCPDSVYETEHLDEKAKAILASGGTVYLSPASTKEALPSSIQAQFTTDFWSVGTFASQQGGMGQLIDSEHPLFQNFPTEFHTNWQWWPMAVQRAVILPKRYRAIITEMDSYAFLRPMAQLIEFRCGGGKLLFSAMGLQNLQQYPEARALQREIYRYLDSENFLPEQEISLSEMEALVK